MNKRALSRLNSWLAMLALTCLLAGCSNSTTKHTASGPGGESLPASSEWSIDLLEVDREAYDRILATHRGKVVLVDFWATWCLPCIQQFPHTVELAKNTADRGLVVITVSLDDPADAQRITDFLRSHEAVGMTHLVSQFGSGARSVDAFEIPGGAVPHYKIYDRTGELHTSFALDPASPRPFTTADIDAALDELLNP